MTNGIAPAVKRGVKETFIFAVCLTVAAALAFYLLAMQELGEMGRGPGVATLKQLKKMNEITLKDPDATTAKVLEEMSRLTRKDDDSTKVRRVATTTQPKRQSKLHRQLEAAIAKAEQTVAEAEEATNALPRSCCPIAIYRATANRTLSFLPSSAILPSLPVELGEEPKVIYASPDKKACNWTRPSP